MANCLGSNKHDWKYIKDAPNLPYGRGLARCRACKREVAYINWAHPKEEDRVPPKDEEWPFGHMSLSMGDFGDWACHACMKMGDDRMHPAKYSCPPAADSYVI